MSRRNRHMYLIAFAVLHSALMLIYLPSFAQDEDPNYSSTDSRYNLEKQKRDLGTLQLQIDGYTFYDQTIIRFDVDGSESFDSDLDAYKKWGDLFVPMIYTKTDIGEDVSINSLPDLSAEIEVPVFLKTKLAGAYVLTVPQYSFDTTTIVVLIDNNDLSETILAFGIGYSFQSTSDYDGQRFTIRFTPLTTNNTINKNNDLNIYCALGSIIANGVKKGDALYIYDLSGRLVKSYTLVDDLLNIPLNLEFGIYTVVLESQYYRSSKRLLFK